MVMKGKAAKATRAPMPVALRPVVKPKIAMPIAKRGTPMHRVMSSRMKARTMKMPGTPNPMKNSFHDMPANPISPSGPTTNDTSCVPRGEAVAAGLAFRVVVSPLRSMLGGASPASMPHLCVLHGKKNIPALGLETKKKGNPARPLQGQNGSGLSRRAVISR